MRTEVVHHIESTNTELMRRARLGEGPGIAILAAEQTAGRGQPGRSWDSPVGGMYLSALVTDADPGGISPAIRAGLAVCRTLRSATALPIRLKWPNDCYLSRNKLAGILVERAPEDLLVAGVGINIGPQDQPGRVGLSKDFAPGDDPGASARWLRLGQNLAEALERGLGSPQEDTAVLQQWEDLSVLPQLVSLPDGRRGTATGLKLDGSLRVQMEDGTDVQIVSSAGLEWPNIGRSV